MKNLFKLLPVLALVCCASAAQAQSAPAKMKMHKSGKMVHGKMEHDHMMMKDGKMMMMKGGTMMPMTETMTLANGTQVMADGTCMMKDGKKMMLKEGQEIGTDGKMHMDTPHDKKMADGKMKGKM
ncbi:MAG: hypothetical protein M3Y54_12515 [Bacteroidota bacterium]|nr:hypothetical protein [Bacteroidota bacterium]